MPDRERGILERSVQTLSEQVSAASSLVDEAMDVRQFFERPDGADAAELLIVLEEQEGARQAMIEELRWHGP